MSPKPFVFGIHPFGVAGMPRGVASGAPDDFSRLPGIIDELRGGRPLLLRAYIPFTGGPSVSTALQLVKMYAGTSLPWDIVLAFRSDGNEIAEWLGLIQQLVTRFGSALDSLQITSEPNLRGMPDAGDGARPWVMQALREGVLRAKATARSTGNTLAIGFNAVPTFETEDDFWPAVKQFGQAFIDSLDYVGLDFYPDVFGTPIPVHHLPAAIESVLRRFRNHDLLLGGIPPSLPVRITENGWPTGVDRTPPRQAAVLESIIRTIHALRGDLNITHYELFGLRDADSEKDVSFFQFGIMRDDYTRKPAFDVYKRLIQELK